jgi:hypothetical protein
MQSYFLRPTRYKFRAVAMNKRLRDRQSGISGTKLGNVSRNEMLNIAFSFRVPYKFLLVS